LANLFLEIVANFSLIADDLRNRLSLSSIMMELIRWERFGVNLCRWIRKWYQFFWIGSSCWDISKSFYPRLHMLLHCASPAGHLYPKWKELLVTQYCFWQDEPFVSFYIHPFSECNIF